MKRLVGLILSFSACAAGHDGQWRLVRGDALRELFADRDLGDGVHYAYQFHRDGLLTGMNMGKAERGAWKVSSSELCYLWSRRKSQEECYEVRRRGDEVRLFRDGYEAFSGILAPIIHKSSKEETP